MATDQSEACRSTPFFFQPEWRMFPSDDAINGPFEDSILNSIKSGGSLRFFICIDHLFDSQ